MDLAVVIDPADDHVSPGATGLGCLRETESDIAEGLHLDLKRNVPLAGRPQHQEVVVQHGAVLPLNGNDTADEKNKEEGREGADRSLHLSESARGTGSKHLKEHRKRKGYLSILDRDSRLQRDNLCYSEM